MSADPAGIHSPCPSLSKRGTFGTVTNKEYCSVSKIKGFLIHYSTHGFLRLFTSSLFSKYHATVLLIPSSMVV
jgi:hypothetical protein